MAPHPTIKERRPRPNTLDRIETDPSHHLTGSFLPQTPLDTPVDGSASPIIPSGRQRAFAEIDGVPVSQGFLHDLRTFRWIIVPKSAFQLLLIPIFLHLQWIIVTPLVLPSPAPSPFAPLLFISYPTPSPTGDDLNDPRYRKGYLDFVFLAYYMVVWSFVRQAITIWLCRPTAKYFGLKEAKLARFGEQGYAAIYFAFFGIWGIRIMSQLPTWWYKAEYFWIDYPHWEMKPELKCYYLMQASYWCQQLIVLALGLEKPRKDYYELIAHHFVTLWLIGWSYITNLTLIGNAVFVSMDVADIFLALTKLLNYIRWERTKTVSFAGLLISWTYFRHYLNLVILYSVYKDFDLIPEHARFWLPEKGVWMVGWIQRQIFIPIFLLQLLQIFWYFLILRIAYRALFQSVEVDDERSDDEDEDEDENAADAQAKGGKGKNAFKKE